MPNTQIQLKTWDMTLSYKITEDHNEVIKSLQQIASKWVFQGEDSRLYNEDEEALISDDENSSNSSIDIDNIEEFEEMEFHQTNNDTGVINSDEDSDDNWINDDIFDDNEYASNSSEMSDSENEYDSNSDYEDEGYLHWQIKCTLFKRKRKHELLKLLNMTDNILRKAHISPSSNACAGDIWYVMKSDTKITPTYSDKTYEEPTPIPTHISHIELDTLKPFQKEIIDRIKFSKSHRNLNILIDKKGGVGKTALLLYCLTHKEELGFKTKFIPMCESYKDVLGAVYGMGPADCYIIDLPRAVEKNTKIIRGLMAGLEQTRNGVIQDLRFYYKSRIQNTAEIWCFSNVMFNKNLLSEDRWVYWCVGDDEELYLYPSMKKGNPIEYPIEDEIVGGTLDIEENDNDCFSDVSNELMEVGYAESFVETNIPAAVLHQAVEAEPIPTPEI